MVEGESDIITHQTAKPEMAPRGRYSKNKIPTQKPFLGPLFWLLLGDGLTDQNDVAGAIVEWEKGHFLSYEKIFENPPWGVENPPQMFQKAVTRPKLEKSG